MGDGNKPEYRRKDEASKRERQEREKQDESLKIIAALNRVADEQHTANDENTAKEKGKRCREIVTIIGLYVAAAVALIAIVMTHIDSADQIGALNGQLQEMKNQRLLTMSQQRANIRREQILMHPIGEGDQIVDAGQRVLGWNVNPKWKNVGTTDAKSFISWWNITTAPSTTVAYLL